MAPLLPCQSGAQNLMMILKPIIIACVVSYHVSYVAFIVSIQLPVHLFHRVTTHPAGLRMALTAAAAAPPFPRLSQVASSPGFQQMAQQMLGSMGGAMGASGDEDVRAHRRLGHLCSSPQQPV